MLLPVKSSALGVRWLSLSRAEQRAREVDFLRGLLQLATRYEGARFEAGWSPDAEERTAALAQACGVAVTADVTARGPLGPQAVEALAGELPDVLVVDGGPELTVVTLDGWDGLGVWADRWKGGMLQRDLEESWWPAALDRTATAAPETRRDEIDRTLRAHVLVAWERHAYRAFIATMALAALLGLHPWGDRSIGAVAVRLVVILAVVIVLGSVVDRLVPPLTARARMMRAGGACAPPFAKPARS